MVKVKKLKKKGAGGSAEFKNVELGKGQTSGGTTNVTDPVKKREAVNIAREKRGLSSIEIKESRKKKEAKELAGAPEGAGESLLERKKSNVEEIAESEESIIPFTDKGEVAETVAGGTVAAAALTTTAVGVGAIVTGLGAAPVTALAGGILGGVYLIDKFLLSPTELANWAAVDNVAGALNFESGDIVRAVESGEIDRNVGISILEQNIKKGNEMKNEVVTITQKNPKLWASSVTMRSSVDAAIEGMELKLFRITGEERNQTQVL